MHFALPLPSKKYVCISTPWEQHKQGGRSRPVKKTDKAIPNRLLRGQRKLRYWTQSQVAEQLGTTTVNVNRWERGLTSPSLYFRQKLCDLFGKSAEELGLISEAERHEQVVAATVAASSLPALWNVPFRRNPFFTGR